jgi:hypothetical protein
MREDFSQRQDRVKISERVAKLYRFGYYLILQPRLLELAEESKKIRMKRRP